ncbi:Na+/H+ antiporter subunit D [bacterium]|nr:Na+/H+ antiporter subunit D [bacterium]
MLPLVLLAAAAAVAVLPKRWQAALAVGAPLFALALLWRTPGQLDALATLFAYAFLLVALLGGLFAAHLRERLQPAAALLYAGCALGVVTASSWMVLLLYWEAMVVGSAILIWARRTKAAAAAGHRYLLAHVVGGSFLIAGVAMLTPQGVPFSPQVGPLLASDPGAILILLGILVGVAAVGLHAWLPDAYPEATPTGAVFLSAFTTKTGVFVLLRAFTGWDVLVVVGVAMALFGVVYALLANDIRRLLAYHIVSQVGYMVAAVGIGTAMAVDGAAAHAYSHLLYKALLFMAAGAVLYATGRSRLTDLGGLGRRLPWVGAMYMVGALSISGMPLFSGFVGKGLAVAAAEAAHLEGVALLLTLASVGTWLSVGLKLPWFLFVAKAPAPAPAALRPVPAGMWAAMGLTAGLCVLYGVAPGILYGLLPNGAMGPEGVFLPFTVPHVLESLTLLAVAGGAFFVLLPWLKPKAARSLDADWPARALAGPFWALLVRAPAALEDALGGGRDRLLAAVSAWFANPVAWLDAPLRRLGALAPGRVEGPYDADRQRPAWGLTLLVALGALALLLVLAL